MKTIFIPAKSKVNYDIDLPKNLPKQIALAYSIQYEDLAKKIKEKLSKNHAVYNIGQVLGCSKPKFSKTQAILLISDGRFHAINLALTTNLPIYILDKGKIHLIPKEETENLKNMKKASYVNFLNSNKAGILISTKPGQENLKKAIEIKNKLKIKYKDKKSYLFISNNININEFENFSDIQSWINTACPRLDMNSNKIVNADKL